MLRALHVAQTLKLLKLFSQQLPSFFFCSVITHAEHNAQCWISLHSSSNIVGAMHAHHTWSPWSLQSLTGCILSTMTCTPAPNIAVS